MRIQAGLGKGKNNALNPGEAGVKGVSGPKTGPFAIKPEGGGPSLPQNRVERFRL